MKLRYKGLSHIREITKAQAKKHHDIELSEDIVVTSKGHLTDPRTPDTDVAEVPDKLAEYLLEHEKDDWAKAKDGDDGEAEASTEASTEGADEKLPETPRGGRR